MVEVAVSISLGMGERAWMIGATHGVCIGVGLARSVVNVVECCVDD